jgi:hypothetical protein
MAGLKKALRKSVERGRPRTQRDENQAAKRGEQVCDQESALSAPTIGEGQAAKKNLTSGATQ